MILLKSWFLLGVTLLTPGPTKPSYTTEAKIIFYQTLTS
jgi:hypothetical protein